MWWLLPALAADARVELGPQLGVVSPRSALQAGVNPGLYLGVSPAVLQGRVRCGLSVGWAAPAASGTVEGVMWTAREHQSGLLLSAGLLALPRGAPVSPELVFGAGTEWVVAVATSPGGTQVDTDWRPLWLVGVGLAVALPLGTLGLQVAVSGSPAEPRLGSTTDLALRPALAWRWHR